jgi:hypothetical protein
MPSPISKLSPPARRIAMRILRAIPSVLRSDASRVNGARGGRPPLPRCRYCRYEARRCAECRAANPRRNQTTQGSTR